MGGVALFPELSLDGVGILPVIAATLGAAAATYVLRRREHRRTTDVAFLRESQAYFRTIATDVSDAVIAADHDYRIVFWNVPAERMFGYTAEEILGQPLGLLLPRERRETCLAALRRIRQRLGDATARTLELRAVRKDGSIGPRPVPVRVSPRTKEVAA